MSARMGRAGAIASVPSIAHADAAIIALSLLAWLGMWFHMAAMEPDAGYAGSELLMFLVGWVLMLTAMMLPTERSYIHAFRALLATGETRPADRNVRMAGFLAGYAAAWTAYGLIAFALDAALRRGVEALPFLPGYRTQLAGAVLMIAGLYQLSPVKEACLLHCRTPIAFFARYWREGVRGAVIMGGRHGVVCVGCCWALMAIMFLVGTMNLGWMAALTLLMFAEKVLPAGRRLTRPVAVVLCLLGVWMVVAPQTVPLADGPWAIGASICRAER